MCSFLVSHSLNTSKAKMSDREVLKLCEILPSVARKTPKIILQRAEEIFPALRGNLVSVLCIKGFYQLVV
jgi:hypothetical protein